MKDIVIFGAGGLGREVLEIISKINENNLTWNVLGFYDDNKALPKYINGAEFLGGSEEMLKLKGINVVIALGNPVQKSDFVKKFNSNNFVYPHLIHPNVVLPEIGSLFKIGKGSIVSSGVFISVNVEINDFVFINVNSIIGHDVVIQNYTSIMPTVNISGEVIVGEHCYFGVGSIVINRIRISNFVTISAGAVVFKSVDEMNVTLMGNPARILIKK